jgi:hypothetical protein
VGYYLPSGRRRPYSCDISYAEVRRLLLLLWPKYIADQKRTADRCYGGDVSRMAPSCQADLEAALDREARARREFGGRREKWEQRQRELERLRRQRMPPEQRRELERKERDERLRVLHAECDERDRCYARKALLDVTRWPSVFPIRRPLFVVPISRLRTARNSSGREGDSQGASFPTRRVGQPRRAAEVSCDAA